jgi:hypothetical protein
MRSRRALRLALVLAASVLALASASLAAAAGVTGTLRLEPATVQVDNGGTFSLKVISNTTVPISGVSATLKFDKGVLQVTSITRGAAWASAPLFIAGDQKAIDTANQKGLLRNVAASFFPPGTVPAGDQEFITVGFKAIGCGTVSLTVPPGDQVDSSMLDGRDATYGNAIKLTTTGANVTVCQGGGGGISGSLAPGDTGSPGPSDSFDAGGGGVIPGPSSSAAAGGGGLIPSSSPGATQLPADNTGAITSQQASWLTFAMGALGVAAAGLAALILILVGVALVAAAAGGVFLVRYWRRSVASTRVAAPVAVTVHDSPTPLDVTVPVAADGTSIDSGAAPGSGGSIDGDSPTLVVAPLSLSSGDQPLPASNV